MKLIECVPNFSEGKRPEVIEQIITAITSVKGIKLLDRESDPSHNRSVLTFIGPAESVGQAAFQAVEKASQLIDMTKHKGEHPRIGATDVVPFIPLRGATMDDCIKIAREVGKQIGDKLQIPVYLYENAALRPECRNLADVRKGQFEGLCQELGKNPTRNPDFGPNKIHPTAGATVIGAREILIAYNVNLDTDYLDVAKRIAKKIRESSGGMPYVKALGVLIDKYNRQIAQVTMNLTNYKVTPIKKVFDAIKDLALSENIRVLESELIGLAPQDAFDDTTPEELQIVPMDIGKQIIENRL
ncbi:MAG: glutamate formimidoyltransferase [Planctomycetota bacterium]